MMGASPEAISNWPPFGKDGAPSFHSSPGSSFAFPKKHKKPSKSARLVANPHGNSFMDLSDGESEDEKVRRYIKPMIPPKSSKREYSAKAVYREPSLDVPMDVEAASSFGFSPRQSRLGSVANSNYSGFPQPRIVEDDRSTAGSIYSSFSQSQSGSNTPGAFSYSFAADSQPYHASLRETLRTADSYTFPSSSTLTYKNRILSPAPSTSFLDAESPSTTRAPSIRSDKRSMRSDFSGKMGSKMRSLLGITKKA
jgi:hypothetical protein